MAKNVEKRISDLEKKINPEGDQGVILIWDLDPKSPKDKNVRVIEWDNGDDEN